MLSRESQVIRSDRISTTRIVRGSRRIQNVCKFPGTE